MKAITSKRAYVAKKTLAEKVAPPAEMTAEETAIAWETSYQKLMAEDSKHSFIKVGLFLLCGAPAVYTSNHVASTLFNSGMPKKWFPLGLAPSGAGLVVSRHPEACTNALLFVDGILPKSLLQV